MPDETAVTETKPTFGAWLKAFLYRVGNFFIRYPLATAATVLLVVGAVLLAAFGQKIQIGGLLGKLWGKKEQDGEKPVVTPPPDRVDDQGKPIEPGKSDDGGWVQAPVVLPIKPPSILSDPNKVVVVEPGGKEVEIPLPKGVKNTDIKEVILIAPNVYQVANNDKGVDAGKLLEDLEK